MYAFVMFFFQVITDDFPSISTGTGSHTCQSQNDPHMKSFDGKKFNTQLEGEFILYQHKSLPFEVQTINYSLIELF